MIALSLLITISGTYATWTFVKEDPDVADVSKPKAISMENATFLNSHGTYSINVDSLIMKVDAAEGTHNTELEITGEIVITFSPDQYTTGEIKTSGLTSYFNFYVSTDPAWQLSSWAYNGTPILSTLDTAQHTINAIGSNGGVDEWVYDSMNGVFTYTLDASDIADFIELNAIELDTKAKYDAYDDILTDNQISIKISDVLVTP